jgi:hypothetical protein
MNVVSDPSNVNTTKIVTIRNTHNDTTNNIAFQSHRAGGHGGASNALKRAKMPKTARNDQARVNYQQGGEVILKSILARLGVLCKMHKKEYYILCSMTLAFSSTPGV